MATSVTLPALGESVTEGTVTRWLKQVGEEVAVDEPLLEVSTDKVDTEIPSPVAGTLVEIKAGEDETVEVGAELALVGDASEAGGNAGDASPAPAAAEPAAEAPAAEAPSVPAPAEPAPAEPAPAEPAPAAQPTADTGGDGTSVPLPALGESVTEGTVTRWLKQVGEEVAVDEPLLEISTDKVDTEIPSPVAGTLLEIKVSEDETVEVGAELAIVGSGSAGGAAPAPSQPAPAAEAPAAPAPEPAPATPAPATPAPATEDTATLPQTPQRPAAAPAAQPVSAQAPAAAA